MKRHDTPVISTSLVAFLLLFAAGRVAQSQSTRTWVSVNGSDGNDCSRATPCRTLATALARSSAGGEINVLDSGGFGSLTITKSITISPEGFEARVLVSGTNGILINALANDIVVLRGLDLEGLGTGLDGIKILGAGSVLVEKCTINDFAGYAINAATSTAGATKVFIKDTIVRHNGATHGTGGTGGGILLAPTNTVQASFDNVRMERNVFGLKVQGATTVSVYNSVASGNTLAGLSVLSPAVMNVERTVVSNNGTGLSCGNTLRIGNSSISGNTTTVAGTCSSYKNNDIDVVVALTPINPQ